MIKSRGRNEALDWIEHNLEFSKYEQDVDAVIQRFANRLSLQAPQLPLEVIELLEALKLTQKISDQGVKDELYMKVVDALDCLRDLGRLYGKEWDVEVPLE